MNSTKHRMIALQFALVVMFFSGNVNSTLAADNSPPKLTTIKVKSSLDGSAQPSMIWVPDVAKTKSVPMLVYLHSWSGDYRQNNAKWLTEAAKHNAIFLHPNFRGRNDHPVACGSKLARQDILDAMDFVLKEYNVDRSRIYLAGSSGGGHMAMLMAAYHSERFSAVSAWVGISDLAAWYRFHTRGGKEGNYAKMIVASLGGPPGKSKAIDAEYKARSPIHHLQHVGKLPIELCAGIKDGKTGSVPIMHTLNAFNVIAKAGKHATVSRTEIEELWKAGRLSKPQPRDTAKDESYGRAIILRRKAGPARVTIFDGGHEGLPIAGVTWLWKQTRQVK